MKLIRCTVLTALTVLVAGSLSAATKLTGRVYTEGSATRVRVTVWAIGEAVVADPALARRPLASLEAKPGTPFVVSLEDAVGPLRVELAAPGHVALAYRVVFADETELPPAWLPRGREVTLRVAGAGRKPLVVAGSLASLVTGVPFGRWYPCVPTTELAGDGVVAVRALDDSMVAAYAVTAEGRWGRGRARRRGAGSLEVRLASRPVEVAVSDRRGEPVAGVRLAAGDAPAGTAAVTDEKGRATVEVDTKGSWTLVALGDDVAVRTVRRGPPTGTLALTAGPLTEVEVVFPPEDGPLALAPRWLPAALTGGAPRLASGGLARLPFVGRGGQLQVGGRGLVADQLSVEAATPAVVLAPERAVRVEGRVVDGDEAPMAGVPVWSWGTPWWMRSGPMRGRRMAGFGRLERAALPYGVSDSQGRFTIDGLVPGRLRLTAVKAGLPPADSDELEESAGAVAEVVLTLVPGATIEALVTDPDGRPLHGVQGRVLVDREAGRGGGFRIVGFSGPNQAPPAAVAASDGEGRLLIAQAPLGHVIVELALPGYVKRSIRAEVTAAGSDLGTQVLEPGIAVHGRVIDSDGNGVAGVGVFTGPLGPRPGGSPETTSDAQGGFIIADQPREGELFLSAAGEGVASSGVRRVPLPPDGVVEIVVRRTRALEGRVVDRESGEGIEGARVFARASVERRVGAAMMVGMMRSMAGTECDDQGRFRLEGLEPITHLLSVSAPGYADRQLEVDVGVGEAPRPVTVGLDRGLAIRGRVLDAAGRPVAAVDVSAEPAERGSSFSLPDATRTGPDGSFELTGVAPGRYRVSATGGGGERGSEICDAGSEDVELRLELPGAIRGRVTTSDGGTPPATTVRAFASSAQVSVEAGADGRFEIDELPPGRYQLMARASGYAPAIDTVTVDSAATAEVTLELASGGTVRGYIRGLSAQQLERCMVWAGGATTNPSADGAFTLEGVSVGRGEVTATLMPDGRQRKVPYELEDVAVPVDVEIDFAAGLTVTGTVRRAGRGVAGVQVQAAVPGQRSVHASSTDEEGRFELVGLDAGDLDLTVVDDQGRPLVARRIHADADTRVDLDVPAGELHGRVVATASREPVVGARVRLELAAEPPVVRTVMTDDRGTFRVSELPDGDYRVSASAEGYGAAEARATLTMGAGRELLLELGEGEGVTLLVREPDGRPPDRIWVLPMRNGRVEDAISVLCDGDGRARLTSLPAGVTDALVSGTGQALVRLVVPSPEVMVQLMATGRLEVRLPAETPWRVRVVDAASGLIVPPSPWREPARDGWHSVTGGTLALILPAAAYTLEAVGGDGTVHRQAAVVPASGRVTVSFE